MPTTRTCSACRLSQRSKLALNDERPANPAFHLCGTGIAKAACSGRCERVSCQRYFSGESSRFRLSRTWGPFGQDNRTAWRSIAVALAVHIAAVIALAFFPGGGRQLSPLEDSITVELLTSPPVDVETKPPLAEARSTPPIASQLEQPAKEAAPPLPAPVVQYQIQLRDRAGYRDDRHIRVFSWRRNSGTRVGNAFPAQGRGRG